MAQCRMPDSLKRTLGEKGQLILTTNRNTTSTYSLSPHDTVLSDAPVTRIDV